MLACFLAHVVQFALLLLGGVVDTSPSLSLMQACQLPGLRLLRTSYARFVLTIQSVKRTAGHSEV